MAYRELYGIEGYPKNAFETVVLLHAIRAYHVNKKTRDLIKPNQPLKLHEVYTDDFPITRGLQSSPRTTQGENKTNERSERDAARREATNVINKFFTLRIPSGTAKLVSNNNNTQERTRPKQVAGKTFGLPEILKGLKPRINTTTTMGKYSQLKLQ
ncbi:MAG: hypothetical protein Q4G13_02095 [Moraxella sp.]|nr:hypothetical protein [Moraxella sp.]